jgi:hypothetical protein
MEAADGGVWKNSPRGRTIFEQERWERMHGGKNITALNAQFKK